jgi:hypothetical protein
MSQVKNLRAMFENKGDTSPERGRSSGASTPVQGKTNVHAMKRTSMYDISSLVEEAL